MYTTAIIPYFPLVNSWGFIKSEIEKAELLQFAHAIPTKRDFFEDKKIRILSEKEKATQIRMWTSLSLYQQGLKKVPEAIRQLTNLKILDLAGNNLTTLPSWIGKQGLLIKIS